MSLADRKQLEEFVQRWLDANASCEASGDWEPLAEFFHPGATYGWNCGPNDDFMAVGREEIRKLAFGLEMAGLEGWTYPYQSVLIDEQASMVMGLWRQVAPTLDPSGQPYQTAGLGGSWFRYEDGLWAWQRDFFDHGNVGALFFAMMKRNDLSPALTERITAAAAGELAPGHYRRGEAPAPIWPVADTGRGAR